MDKSRGVTLALMLLLSACASIPEHYARVDSHALQDTATTRLGQASRARLLQLREDNGFLPLPSGVDALLMRLHMAHAAERSLDVQYYIWRDDLTGLLFAQALLRAADRGVRVRILVDDVGTRANDRNLQSLDSHPNIEIRLFNPVASRTFRNLGMLTEFSRVNRRMHNKAMLADNQLAVVGGRNIGDEYFGAAGDLAFGDLDVLLLGPVVPQVSTAFDAYWNAPMAVPITALTGRLATAQDLDALRTQLAALVEAQRDSPYVSSAQAKLAEILAAGPSGLFGGKAHLLVDDPAKVTRAPDDTEGHLLPQFAKLGLQARRELLIVSPYFVPGDEGVRWLRGLAQAGLRVTVLTNSLAASDVAAVHAGYKRYRDALLEAGVRLYELKPDAIDYGRSKGKNKVTSGSRASLHAKTFVFDRRTVFVGSLNLDPRSVQLNTEIGVMCESEAFAQALAGGIEGALDQVAWRLERVPQPGGQSRLAWVETNDQGSHRHFDEPGVNAWRQLGVWFFGLLPIESQL